MTTAAPLSAFAGVIFAWHPSGAWPPTAKPDDRIAVRFEISHALPTATFPRFVVLGAPLGSLLGSHFHRLVLASLIYITDGVQFIGALAIVRPWSYHKTDTPL